MKIFTILILALLIQTSRVDAQSLDAYENLVNSKWLAEGKQLGGRMGKTEKVFEWGLDRQMIKVKTFAFLNPNSDEYGLRNEGVRVYDATEEVYRFYEFDVNGGITEGKIYFEDKNIYYEYEYEGILMRDAWEYEDWDTYKYTVGSWINDDWGQIYVQTSFVRAD